MKSAWKQWIVFLALALTVLPVKAQPASPQTAEQGHEALVLLDAASLAAMQHSISEITALGGKVFASFPNQGLFVVLTNDQAQQVRSLESVRLVTIEVLDSSHAGNDPGANHAMISWNARLQNSSPNLPDSLPELPDNDARLPPDWEEIQGARMLSPTSSGQYQTSEYMLRDVQVDVFLPESNGGIDPNTENWTPTMGDQVIAEITNGVLWWVEAATQGGRPSAELAANIVFHTPFNEPAVVATAYEPIQRSSGDQSLWMEEIMGNLGYSGDTFSAIRRYAHDRRTVTGQDWAFTVWVANSAADPDGRFSDGMFGYAYIFGPLVVMTYDNDGWGIAKMEIVMAHEMGHIFGALDEYAASGCTDNQTSGYLNIANTNCENGSPTLENSIMRSTYNQIVAYPARQASTPARGMVGWRDSDGDAIYDPLDTSPNLNLLSSSPNPTLDNTPTWSGIVADDPYPSPTHPDLSINPITGVLYQLDGGSWTGCDPGDGLFDELEEYFACSPPALVDGLHTINIQANNRMGNISQVFSASLLVDTTPPEVPSAADPHCLAVDGVWGTACNDPSFTWDAAGDDGSGLAGYFYHWGKASQDVSTGWTATNSFEPPPLDTPGTYSLQLQAEDNAGNTSQWRTAFTLKYDASPPISRLVSIRPLVCGQSYVVRWAGDGTGSSIVAYDVQYRFGADGPWTDWLLGTNQTSALFGPLSPVNPSPGQVYFFRLRALDEAGNLEDYPPGSTDKMLAIQSSCTLYMPTTIR